MCIRDRANSSNDFFLKDLFEIANSEKMVELSLSDKNTYKTVSYTHLDVYKRQEKKLS